MPTLLAPKDRLFSLIGKTFSDEEFDDLCFKFGIELDDVTSEKTLLQKETGASNSNFEANEEVLYKIEIPANRFDLISSEGLAIALRVYLGLESIPTYSLLPPSTGSLETVHVLPSTHSVRPYFFCAILRDVNLDKYSYDSFIKLQEKLHQTIARNRTLVSMGTHDYDTIKGPFRYEAVEPSLIHFVPLNCTGPVSGTQLSTLYEKDSKMKKYTEILEAHPKYPILYDSNSTTCSVPPLINSSHSKITLSTKNILFDVTSIDPTKGETVLKILLAAFSFYCQNKYTIEPVNVVYSDDSLGPFGSKKWCLSLSQREYKLPASYFNRVIGVSFNAEQICEFLGKMMFKTSQPVPGSEEVLVQVPFQRSDVLHPCDIMEDVAIGYGFANIAKTIPKTSTFGAPFLLNKLSDALRLELALVGFTEALTFCLCSSDENSIFIKNLNASKCAVSLANPKTADYQVARTSLLPGLLKTVSSNKAFSLPFKLFEVSDVVLKDSQTDVGARNERRLAVVYCGLSSGFETLHGVLDHLMKMLSFKRNFDSNASADDTSRTNNDSKPSPSTYTLIESSSETFFPGRRIDIVINPGTKTKAIIGTLGIVHPEVLSNFNIGHSLSAFEINIEPFL